MHVLIATDGSEQSLEAARFARSLLAPAALTRVTVLAVVQPLETVAYTAGSGVAALAGVDFNRLNEEAIQGAREATARTAAELRDLGVPVETSVRTGSPAAEIVHAADELGAGLIVIGSRGWGEVRAIVLGSVSEYVLHHVHCPVLIARPARAARGR